MPPRVPSPPCPRGRYCAPSAQVIQEGRPWRTLPTRGGPGDLGLAEAQALPLVRAHPPGGPRGGPVSRQLPADGAGPGGAPTNRPGAPTGRCTDWRASMLGLRPAPASGPPSAPDLWPPLPARLVRSGPGRAPGPGPGRPGDPARPPPVAPAGAGPMESTAPTAGEAGVRGGRVLSCRQPPRSAAGCGTLAAAPGRPVTIRGRVPPPRRPLLDASLLMDVSTMLRRTTGLLRLAAPPCLRSGTSKSWRRSWGRPVTAWVRTPHQGEPRC
jgi:hypothetical protein